MLDREYLEDLKAKTNLFALVKSFFGSPEESGWSNVTIMGEWAGPGIQSGVALSQIEKKHWFPFAVFIDRKEQSGRHDVHYASQSFWDLIDVLWDAVDWIEVLQPHGYYKCNARDRNSIQKMVDLLNEDVLKIEECDPVCHEYFGVEGTGEGLVLYPVGDYTGICSKTEFETFGFKVKGEKHAVSKAGKPARIKSDIPETAFQFVEMHVTEARLEQGLQETGGELLNENIGKFIGWVARDVALECAQEIAESGMDWKGCLAGVVTTRARNWFFEKQKEVA